MRKIEAFLRQTKMPQTGFGRRAINGPQFVFDLRRGGLPRPSAGKRVEPFMKDYRRNSHAA
jgi:hypothetical protein